MGISVSSTVNSVNTKYHMSVSSGGGPDWSIIPSSGKSSKSKAEFTDEIKADKKSHGLGLANIKSTAEKYQGTMDFRVKDRVFILSVMMKNERRNEDGFWSDK